MTRSDSPSPVAETTTLLAYLLGPLGLKRKAAKDFLRFGAVLVNDRPVRQFDYPLSPGDLVAVTSIRSGIAQSRLRKARIDIVYEDDAVLVLDKPAGLLTVANQREKEDTLAHRLNGFLRDRDPTRRQSAVAVHRLDHGTSGLVLFAKSEEVRQRLIEIWPEIEKTYLAVVHGKPRHESGEITTYLTESKKSLKVRSTPHPIPGARKATTLYRLLETAGRYALVEARLATGRKHQIRVHLAEIGCPVVGDWRYGKPGNRDQRLALHAARLSLAQPVTGEPLCFESPLPGPLSRLLAGERAE